MLCEKCKKNEAKVNLVTIVNGQKQEIWLCENCVKDIVNIPFFNPILKNMKSPFEGMLTEILSNVDNDKGNSDNNKVKELICDNCGLTYDEFKKTGKLGCANCYQEFKVVLEPRIKSLQTGIKHIGKVPKKKGLELIKSKKLKDLKQEMQRLIVTEEYEKAAIIRDEIRKLELYILESNLKNTINIREETCDE